MGLPVVFMCQTTIKTLTYIKESNKLNDIKFKESHFISSVQLETVLISHNNCNCIVLHPSISLTISLFIPLTLLAIFSKDFKEYIRKADEEKDKTRKLLR